MKRIRVGAADMRTALLDARAQRSTARLRDAFVGVLLSEADAEHRLNEIENDAWVIAQDSRSTRGVGKEQPIWRFGQIGACRAALIADRDPSASRALALRARDRLRYSHKTYNSDGSLPSPQTSMSYGELLVLLGEANEAHRVFLEAAEHLRNRYGAKHACTRLFSKRAAECGA